MQTRINAFITQFNDLFNGKPWLDETFSKKLDQLSEEQAFTRAPDNNHSVAEVVWHLIVWRKEVLRRLNENTTTSNLPDESSENWKDVSLLKLTGWPKLYADFKDSHKDVITFLLDKTDDYLDEMIGLSDCNKEYYIAGLVHHDAYHLGQIGLILKWAR
ncbi:DinB family protein [Segetibacter sp. 3557_3]|uniref:DinB family protein n=1 Tax=Segetibacter sp. 3557_3 TaxID=2547429 RepID=UPI001058A447|nr:DinB family protein [Segetibacter sp. 3557_3]TDH27776.1 DinB family protein [Segetibacter sp. 3557_3]